MLADAAKPTAPKPVRTKPKGTADGADDSYVSFSNNTARPPAERPIYSTPPTKPTANTPIKPIATPKTTTTPATNTKTESKLLAANTTVDAKKLALLKAPIGSAIGKNKNEVILKRVVKPPKVIPIPPECLYKPDLHPKLSYKEVPLATHKAYFGNMSDYVNEFVHKYLEIHNTTLSCVKGRAETQFPKVDNILKQHNLPKELKYLAVIESALNNNAVSPVGAVGPWQFMDYTGRLMGLKISRRNDDRRNLEKSTAAAAKYLEILYGQMNDWLLVIAAYNSGPTPVQRAIERTGSYNFWDIKEYLPRETQGHVLAFIATATIFEKLSKFIGVDDLPDDLYAEPAKELPCIPDKKPMVKSPFTPEELKNMVIVRITDPLHLDIVAKELNVEKSILMKWNRDYDLFLFKTYPTEYYNFRLPKDKLEQFMSKKELLTQRSKQRFAENSN
jgi:membrane-bound lytic murein transglycosylase D